MRAIGITLIRPMEVIQHPCRGGNSTEEFGRRSVGGSSWVPAPHSLHWSVGVEGIVVAG